MSQPKDEAWFPARRYGYGWDFPARWQGWLVIFAYVIAFVVGTPLIRAHPAYFTIYIGALSTGLILICLWKGESPRWRWGDPKMK